MRADKQLYLDEVKDKIAETSLLMLVQYQNMNANLTADLRKELFDAGGEMTVVSKRVLMKAAKEAGIDLIDSMNGHIAIVTSKESAIDATKSVFKFRKGNKDNVEILGGQFEGQVCSSADLEKVANLPTRDEMRAQLLSVFEAPMAQTVAVMQTIVSVMPTLLNNKAEKEE